MAVDSLDIKPIYVDSFSFYVGQRVDVVLCTNSTAADWTLEFNSAQPDNGSCGPGEDVICSMAASIR